MNVDSVKRITDELAGLSGGYNAKRLLTALLVALGIGFLLGGLLGTWFGYLFLLLPLCLGLLVAGFVAWMKFRGGDALGGLGQLGHSSRGGEDRPGINSPNVPLPSPMPPPQPIIPDGFSRLEWQIMERVGRNDGTLSVRALSIELDVPEESVRKAIEELADRGTISLE